MNSLIKTLIFDLDGTLADTIPAITEAVNMTMESLSLPTHTEDEVRTYINHGPRHLIKYAIPDEIVSKNPEIVDTALDLYNKMYAKTYMHTDFLYDGMLEVISELSKHYKIAILSNKQDEYVKALANQLLPRGICSLACGSLDGIPAKPDPTIANKMLNELSMRSDECVLIGDSSVDIKTAQNANISCVSVTWGYASKDILTQNGAEVLIHSPKQLLEFFKEAQNEHKNN